MSDKVCRQIDTAKLANDILTQSRKSATEEDLKMAVEPVLRRAFRDIGVDVEISNMKRERP